MMKKSVYFQSAALAFLLLMAAGIKAQTSTIPRSEHPRPDFVRADWQTLNGDWEFEFDDADRGLAERWYASGSRRFTKNIRVPYAFQSKLSGIGDTAFHDVVWYRRTLQIPETFRRAPRRVMLHFGAVDYEAVVWVNGERAGKHQGGHVGFHMDVTDLLKAGENQIVVRAWDPSTDRTIPRGKQYWKPSSEAIWYTRTSGIWQPVWLEAVSPTHLERLRITPDIDNSQVQIEAILNKPAADARLRLSASLRGEVQARSEFAAIATGGANPATTLTLDRQETWSPDRPTLYDLEIELVGADGQVLDRVTSYFGQRKVSVHGGRIYLNNAPYYLKMVLDQGYWPESVLTPPTDEAIQYDIKMTKAFGFNGARKHQKVEVPALALLVRQAGTHRVGRDAKRL